MLIKNTEIPQIFFTICQYFCVKVYHKKVCVCLGLLNILFISIFVTYSILVSFIKVILNNYVICVRFMQTTQHFVLFSNLIYVYIKCVMSIRGLQDLLSAKGKCQLCCGSTDDNQLRSVMRILIDCVRILIDYLRIMKLFIAVLKTISSKWEGVVYDVKSVK